MRSTNLQLLLLLLLLYSLHLFYGYALCNPAIQATETNKCHLICHAAVLEITLRISAQNFNEIR